MDGWMDHTPMLDNARALWIREIDETIYVLSTQPGDAQRVCVSLARAYASNVLLSG